MEQIDGIAVTYAPGLIGALLVGVSFAKGLALTTGKPLIPVHHLRSHIASNYLAHPDLKPPFLCLVVSGGHSHIVQVEDYTKFKVIGRTRDDAAGECYDKAARAMGMPYPGGVALDKLAHEGDPHAFPLPHPRVEGSEYDFSFSGLKTAVLNRLHNAEQKGEEIDRSGLAAYVAATISDELVPRAILAAKRFGHHTVVAAGGVAANKRVRADLEKACAENGLRLFLPPLKLCGDNGCMIGAQGYYEYLAGHTADMTLNAYANMEI
jgi:N6-L-threonylcarbamoyladenine synthase